MGLPPTKPRVMASYHIEATAFLHEIVAVADSLKQARAFDGSEPLRFDARWRLLRAIERTDCCPSFSDLARSLRVSRQAVRELVATAEKTDSVRSFVSSADRRIVQVALTPVGRRTLEAQRLPDFGWIFTLLSGLEPVAMRATVHVLRVVRRRLERYAQEMAKTRA